MIVNNARSVSEALSRGLHHLRLAGIRQPSRVGDVLVSPMPVLTVYEHPTNRVLFSPLRDANPFFHVMESLWMLAGRNDLPWLTRFNSKFTAYSDDDGKTQPGAYGYRWRWHFGYDQLEDIINELKKNPQSRRAVLAMWDATGAHEGDQRQWPGDLMAGIMGSADVPCNTHAYFDTIDGKLNMTVCCRSNDIIWGAYGANAVHFSFLLEYMAAMTGIPMGVYRQFSNNFHLYTNVVPEPELMPWARDVEWSDAYMIRDGQRLVLRVLPLRKVPLVGDPETFMDDLHRFMAWEPGLVYDMENYFFTHVAAPMRVAWDAFKRKDWDDALDACERIRAEDWRIACKEWITRRMIKAQVNEKPFTEITDGNA